MPANLDGLSDVQLKVRKQIAKRYLDILADEMNHCETMISTVGSKMQTNPKLDETKMEEQTIPQLEELKIVHSQILLRAKAIGTGFQKDVEKIDALIIQKR